MGILNRLRALYRGDDAETRRFHAFLAAFDLATIAFLIVSSFFEGSKVVEIFDLLIGLAILAELVARVAASRSPRREIFNPYGFVDVVVVISLLAPVLGEGFAFLRVLRLLRLVRSYEALRRFRGRSTFGQYDETMVAGINLAVFLFVTTAFVYESQHRSNDQINDYADALYFTVTTLTTTGYGDITLKGDGGRLLAVTIMIIGVSLFLRLVQVMIRPAKVAHKCPDCGLSRHDYDAVHCKACGRMLNIEDEGG